VVLGNAAMTAEASRFMGLQAYASSSSRNITQSG